MSDSRQQHRPTDPRRYEWGGLLPRQWSVLGALVLLLGGCFSFIATDGFTTERYHGNWDSFYERNVKYYFRVPPEAKIISAVRRTPFLDVKVEVVFELPETTPPEEWIKQIARDSGLGEECRVSPFSYMTRGVEISFNPQTGRYTGRGWWD